GGEHVPSRYPVRSFVAVAYERTRDFFDGVYPALAAAGLSLMWRERGSGASAALTAVGVRRWLVLGWLGAYLLLLAGRAKVPDVFLHGHETLLVTPLVCLAAGEAMAWVAGRGRHGRVAALVIGIILAIQGLHGQWAALELQLGNAR
ncbi:MAG TPA: hypothetical protein VMR21_10060, partial [Vicinamibacteria bacterium]|nr:hypothetical protein [Vicinamibacteria bacterium]